MVAFAPGSESFANFAGLNSFWGSGSDLGTDRHSDIVTGCETWKRRRASATFVELKLRLSTRSVGVNLARRFNAGNKSNQR